MIAGSTLRAVTAGCNAERRKVMRRHVRMLALVFGAVLVSSAAAAPLRAGEPSMKEGFKEVGEAIKDDAKKAGEKTEDAAKSGLKASEEGVGKAMEKTGAGIEHGGQRVKEAGE
jgi:hypothetical protein